MSDEGKIYSITWKVADACGNVATATDQAGSLATKPGLSDKVNFILSDGNFSFEFSALNYDYQVLNNARAIYKGLGKTIINGVE
jgi:hypothetical protein